MMKILMSPSESSGIVSAILNVVDGVIKDNICTVGS